MRKISRRDSGVHIFSSLPSHLVFVDIANLVHTGAVAIPTVPEPHVCAFGCFSLCSIQVEEEGEREKE